MNKSTRLTSCIMLDCPGLRDRLNDVQVVYVALDDGARGNPDVLLVDQVLVVGSFGEVAEDRILDGPRSEPPEEPRDVFIFFLGFLPSGYVKILVVERGRVFYVLANG